MESIGQRIRLRWLRNERNDVRSQGLAINLPDLAIAARERLTASQ